MTPYILGTIAAFIASVSHIILKIGANKKKLVKGFSYFINFHTVTGYFLMFLSTLLNLYVFNKLDLKLAFLFFPLTYILVFILSILILKEKASSKKIISYLIILAGIIVFNS